MADLIGHLPRTDLPLLVLGTWYSPFPSTKSPLLVLGMHPHPGP